jgi:spore coat-associated protein N
MSVKKKMSMGILAGALGVSLIGGGTWAAFNDVEATDNSFKAGTLDLVVGETTTMDFEIKNLKPGDYFTKKLVLDNNGSLDINQIKIHATKEKGWEDKDILGLNSKVKSDDVKNNEDEFLEQFSVVISPEGSEEKVYEDTLAKLVSGKGVDELTDTDTDKIGLKAGSTAKYDVKVTFTEDPETFEGSRIYKQNKYQGEESKLKFVFEATQMPGENRTENDVEAE